MSLYKDLCFTQIFPKITLWLFPRRHSSTYIALDKKITSFEYVHILSSYSSKYQVFVLYVIDLHKVAHNWEVKAKGNILFKMFFTNNNPKV